MKKGIFTFTGNDLPLEKRFAMIKDAGFDSVIIWWEDEFGESKAENCRLAEKYRLEICNAHLPYEDINNIWTSDGDDYEESVCSQIRECGDYRIPIVVMHLTKGLNPPPYNKEGLKRFKRIVEMAEKSGTVVALENLRYTEYLTYIFENIKSENLGFCFDSGHNNYFTPNRDILKQFADNLIALHIDDNMGDEDIHMLPYDGTIDWGKYAESLASLNYNGVLSLEVQQDRHKMYENMSCDEFFKSAYEKAIRLESEIKKFRETTH